MGGVESVAQIAAEHPLRRELADEVHARPPTAAETPSRATYVAMLVGATERAAELAHIASMCTSCGVNPPAPSASQFSWQVGRLQLRWERHGEFSGFTFTEGGNPGTAFEGGPVALLPEGWLAGLPGQTLVAAHALLIAAPPVALDAETLTDWFGAHQAVGSAVGDGAGQAYSDFRLHEDGFSRFLLVDAGFTPRQAGRMLQRLFEIETYRMMALLAFPVAKQQSARLPAIERSLAAVTASIAGEQGDDEALLAELTRLAAEVESCISASQFRFSACRAYSELVSTRIAELREGRLGGVQPIGEFMARRFMPAVATVSTAAQRLHDLSERVARASALLSTRVDIATERQNQALLASMDRRARQQFRLQQTVEGLSLAAIVYYAAGLVGYVAKAAKSAGAAVNPDLVAGASVPLLGLAVWLAMRRWRRHALRG